MTVQELYANIGGSYENARRILPMDKMIAKFIVRFLDDKSFEKLMTAHESGDGAGMFEGAHALKGVCGNLGLTSLSEAASAVAEEFRPGKARTMDDAALSAHLAALKETYEKTVEGIRAFAAEQ